MRMRGEEVSFSRLLEAMYLTLTPCAPDRPPKKPIVSDDWAAISPREQQSSSISLTPASSRSCPLSASHTTSHVRALANQGAASSWKSVLLGKLGSPASSGGSRTDEQSPMVPQSKSKTPVLEEEESGDGEEVVGG